MSAKSDLSFLISLVEKLGKKDKKKEKESIEEIKLHAEIIKRKHGLNIEE